MRFMPSCSRSEQFYAWGCAITPYWCRLVQSAPTGQVQWAGRTTAPFDSVRAGEGDACQGVDGIDLDFVRCLEQGKYDHSHPGEKTRWKQ